MKAPYLTRPTTNMTYPQTNGNSTIVPQVKPSPPTILNFSDMVDKLDMSMYPLTVIDAEWYGQTFLTKQVTFAGTDYKPQVTVVVWNDFYPLPTEYPLLDHPLYIITASECVSIIDCVKLAPKLLLHLYYSPKDLTAFFGRKVFTDLLSKDDVPLSKLRNITGKFKLDGTEFKIQDALGLFNSSLESGLESVGTDTSKSKLLAKDWDKSRMELWIKDNPNTFLQYAIGDTIQLMESIPLRVEQINTIINNVLGHNLGDYTTDTIKFSSGALVNDTFVRWFAHEYPDVFQTALKLSQSNDNKAWKVIKDVRVKLKEVLEPSQLLSTSNQLKYQNIVNGIASGSINGIGVGRTNTGLFGTVVQGGRCINEEPHINPYDNRVKNVFDIDLSSCYGTALKDFDFPVGLPTIYGKDIDDESLTLGEFLKLHESELVDGLYTIYISGNLDKTRQDLVFSKYKLTTKTILKKLFTDFEDSGESFDGWGREVETAHMGGDFALTKKQIELGIITADVLKVIRAVASTQELKEWMEIPVISAVYYPSSLEVDISKWARYINNNLGYKTDKKDTRSRAWCRFSLDNFIGKFIDYRKDVKKTSKNKGDEADLIQTSVKLFINTTYGCLAAPYFEMGNTVIANNITAKARTGVWMMSKALLTVQSITDGGMFSGDRVAVITGNKPSLTTLANRQKMLAHQSLKTISLIDIDKKRELVKLRKGKELDKLCREHIAKFWSNYGLEMPFDIECKYENCGDKAVYFGSSDYIIDVKCYDLKTKDEKSKPYEIKCRGAKESNHPKKLWLSHLLDPTSNPIPPIEFPYTEIVGFNDYLKNKIKYQKLNLLPGDDLGAVTYHRPFKNGQTFETETTLVKFEGAERSYDNRWNVEKNKPYGLVAKVMGVSYPKSIDIVSA